MYLLNIIRNRSWWQLGFSVLTLVIVLSSSRPAAAAINVRANFVKQPNGVLASQGAPYAGMILGPDQNFYGTTPTGGSNGGGTVFKVTPAGVLTTLVSFSSSGATGAGPTNLTLGADGNFYGATAFGGASGAGTIFELTPAGGLTALASLSRSSGFQLTGRLVEDAGGNFYGVMAQGGGDNEGSIVKLAPGGVLSVLLFITSERPGTSLIKGADGNIYLGLISLTGAGGRIAQLSASGALTTVVTLGGAPSNLIETSDGSFYGTTGQQSFGINGTVFRYNPATDSGWGVQTLVTFSSPTFLQPDNLLLGPDGDLYGTTSGSTGSPPFANGTFFKIATTGGLTVIKSYPNETGEPVGALTLGPDGNFYGVSQGDGRTTFGSIFRLTTNGITTPLFAFTSDGPVQPEGALVETTDGNFYGTSYAGGASDDGTVFKITPDGTILTLASFNGTNGKNPSAGLVLATDGNFYGTTYGGGTAGDGTVFQVTPAGVLTTLVSFDGTNGANPYAALIQAKDGMLYGTTFGTYNGGVGKEGTLFKMTLGGVLTTLVTFNGSNGANPYAALLQAKDGNFYGTTDSGGTGGGGIIFRLTQAGSLTTMATFTGPNGYRPSGTLVQGPNSDLYGTTEEGQSNISNVYEISLAGSLKILVSQNVYDGTGEYLTNGLLLADDGNFYLAANYAGPTGLGDVYQVTPDGALRDFGDFSGTNGSIPRGTLIQGRDGNLYGTASGGGTAGGGVFYEVSLGLQTITFPRLYDEVIGQTGPVTLAATASSGLPITYHLVEGSAELTGNVLTVDGGGEVIVAADQAGNADYGPAPEATQSFYVFQGSQKVIFPAIPDQIYSTTPIPLAATDNPTGGGNYAVSNYTVTGPATVIQVSLSPFYGQFYYALQLSGAGTVTVTATAPANQSFTAASQTRIFHVYLSNQTITFPKVAGPTLTQPNQKVTLGATATSGLPVVYHLISGPGTVSGNTLTFTGPGAVVVRAIQAGNTNYAPAPPVTQAITAVMPRKTQTITLPTDRVVTFSGQPITVGLAVTATSGLPVELQLVSGAATLSGTSLTITSGVSDVILYATQSGNAAYVPAAPVKFKITVIYAPHLGQGG